ncbi:unnamed protein product, partial [Effrenium voratum]
VVTEFATVETWPLATDRVHFAVEAKEDLVSFWDRLLRNAPYIQGGAFRGRTRIEPRREMSRRETSSSSRSFEQQRFTDFACALSQVCCQFNLSIGHHWALMMHAPVFCSSW